MKKPTFNPSVKLLLLLTIFMLNLPSLDAKICLPQFVGDRMVLQRDAELKIWGWADPGDKVTVRFRGSYYDAEPDAEGKWSVTLPPQSPGGPFIMEVNEIIIRDVLVGDVWLCSGQSNQETPIARLVDMFPEINVSNNHMIRHYKVPTQQTPDAVKEKITGNATWHSATASDVMNWTALAYFFAQEAYAHNKVPVGMLVSSLGGSSIESWISREHLKEFPGWDAGLATLEEMKSAEKDKGANRWNSTLYNDSDWKTTTVPGSWKENGMDVKGVVWYRKDFQLPASMDRKHAKLYLGTLIDSDSVFVNGHFVGTTSYQYPPRKYDIPGGILKQGSNNITVRLTANGGNGEFVPDKPYKIVSDDFETTLTGTWKYKVGKDHNEVKQFADRLPRPGSGGAALYTGSGLYNGMIYPLRDYSIKGAIWYQGEANTGSPGDYAALLQSLISNWRELWHRPDLPFLLVQLPNLGTKDVQPADNGWARLREAQLQTGRVVPHTALAVTYDTGEWNDIHPLNKKDVAHRLFLGARNVVYGEKLVSSGPVYKDMKIEGNKIVLSFTDTGSGLTANGKPLKHFAIAGDDQRFVWAEAVIKGNKVIVSSPEVPNPVAVRYAWAGNPEEANLRNKEGLPASPFRTDDW